MWAVEVGLEEGGEGGEVEDRGSVVDGETL